MYPVEVIYYLKQKTPLHNWVKQRIFLKSDIRNSFAILALQCLQRMFYF